ncbi:MAG: thiolase family protein [Candidatus Melainabacteria bacterium]|nr:thiolase family protein [Candidatus Melainabacteria bacterium]
MTQKQSAYVIEAVRTPTGRRGGGLSKVHPVTLGVTVAKEVVKRAGIKAELINECIVGCATQTAEQGLNLGRFIALSAFSPKMPASTVNMLCGSSAEAIRFGAALVASSEAEVVLVLGVENNLMVFQGQDLMPSSSTFWGNVKNLIELTKRGINIVNLSLPKDYKFHSMGKSGDAIAKKYNHSFQELNQFGLDSHMKAASAMYNGKFNDEIVPVYTPGGFVSFDESIRPDTSLTKLSKLKSAFGGLHTAGTSSQISAGAAALLIANDDAIKKYNLKPMSKIIASSVVGTNPEVPEEQLIGPVYAIPKVLEEAALHLDKIDLFEINEAFASVVLATQEELNIPWEKINVNGGAIALGHPLGVSGVRLPVTLLYEMQRRGKEGKPSKYGLAALCIGGGQAIATIFERV